MNNTLEDISLTVGKDDGIAGITFKHNTDAFKKYGSFVTVVFQYTQDEREELDKLIQTEPFSHHGILRVKYVGTGLSADKIEQLTNEGIQSEEIAEILFHTTAKTNTFHNIEKRTINKLEIPMRSLPKGRDLDWMYGFKRKIVAEGVGLSPKEKDFYLAGKYYYEPKNLSKEESLEIYDDKGILNENIEWELLQMKNIREEISEEEKRRLAELYRNIQGNNIQALDLYLKQAGSSLKKLAKNNIKQATELFIKTMKFKERRLTINAKHPIYIDLDSYLHIYMRHVEDFQVNEHFEHKDNFQWNEEDVFSVMEHVIKSIDAAYQEYREKYPEQRYSKYGNQSIYFQGDYYTFHIEPNGRISTFHKNRKEHEKKAKEN